MPERLNESFPEIITGPEDLPHDITLEKLVETVGGKAAGLLWIQKHLPDIPTAKMITATPEVATQTIIETAKAKGLKLPWIIRPSTPVDNLPGAEGLLNGANVDKDKDIAAVINYVRNPKRNFSGSFCRRFGLQPITVGVAEYSISNLAGTMIGHPHLENYFLTDLRDIKDEDDRKHAVYVTDDTHATMMRWFSSYSYSSDNLKAEIAKPQSVYSQIMKIAEFSPQMTYQLEFGLNPFLVYQIRDFLPKAKAGFSLEGGNFNEDTETLVFGITPEQGVELQIYEYDKGGGVDLRQKTAVLISDDFSMKSDFSREVNLFYQHHGFLSHLEVSRIRTTPLSILRSKGYSVDSGDRARIISDGVRVKIIKL